MRTLTKQYRERTEKSRKSGCKVSQTIWILLKLPVCQPGHNCNPSPQRHKKLFLILFTLKYSE